MKTVSQNDGSVVENGVHHRRHSDRWDLCEKNMPFQETMLDKSGRIYLTSGKDERASEMILRLLSNQVARERVTISYEDRRSELRERGMFRKLD